MDEARQGYVEDFGVLFEGVGGSRMVGRVLGLLLVSETPELSAEEIAGRLRASQGAVSTATRTLVGTGLVRRRTRPGERRAYFGVNPDAWQETTRQQVAASAAFREMAERGLDLTKPGDPEARSGLEAMRDFYGFWERELSAVLARWDEEEKRRRDREAG
jgi:DNA-binding transcriptional regulator GbsR (MarR family)